MNCEVCGETAEYIVFASYEQPSPNVHPVVNRYPQPMIITCGSHLTAQLERDSHLEGTTNLWVVSKITD